MLVFYLDQIQSVHDLWSPCYSKDLFISNNFTLCSVLMMQSQVSKKPGGSILIVWYCCYSRTAELISVSANPLVALLVRHLPATETIRDQSVDVALMVRDLCVWVGEEKKKPKVGDHPRYSIPCKYHSVIEPEGNNGEVNKNLKTTMALFWIWLLTENSRVRLLHFIELIEYSRENS